MQALYQLSYGPGKGKGNKPPARGLVNAILTRAKPRAYACQAGVGSVASSQW